jgi:hypothetical protein
LIQRSLDNKIARFQDNEKENSNKIARFQDNEKENSNNSGNVIRDLDSLKMVTKCRILHILNRGSVKSLMTLKTIGKKRAETIFNDREVNGEFLELNDLLRAGFKPTQISNLFQSNMELF